MSTRRKPYVSTTAMLTPYDLSEQRRNGEDPHAYLRFVIPHGAGQRHIVVNVGLDEVLRLCANAADAARLLAPYREMQS